MAYLRAVGTKGWDADPAVGSGCKMLHVAMLWQSGLKPQLAPLITADLLRLLQPSDSQSYLHLRATLLLQH